MFKKNKENIKKEHNNGQVFTRIMAAILVLAMLSGTIMSLVFALIGE